MFEKKYFFAKHLWLFQPFRVKLSKIMNYEMSNETVLRNEAVEVVKP